MTQGDNTLQQWRRLAAEGTAAGEFTNRIAAAPEAARRTAIAWVEPDVEGAWSRAAQGPLHGVPFLVKDLFDVARVSTRAGSTFLAGERSLPANDSALVRRFRELGGVPVAKTHLNEFAYGATGENAHSGDCFQLPHPDRLTGGSSSGSAWGVQARIAPIGFGTDTGGSSRIPPAFCGLWGIRLAPGHWSISDVFPLAPSFDSAGWFTTCAADMRETLSLVLGIEPSPAERRAEWVSLADLGETEPEMDRALSSAAARFARPASPRVARIVRECVEQSLAAYHVIVAREALAVHRPFLDKHANEYDPVVLMRLKRAMQFTDTDEAAARAAMASVRKLLREATHEAGAIAMPVSPVPALTKAQCDDAHRARIIRLNAPASLAGLPALTVPVPIAGGLSGGIQVVCSSLEPESMAPAFAAFA